MDEMNRKMNRRLDEKIAELTAGNDETGDGRLDAADLKAQLNRIEAQLDLQDAQNRQILRSGRIRLWITCILAVVLLAAVAVLWVRTNDAYTRIESACTQVEGIAETLQESIDQLDPEEWNTMVQDLPEVAAQLKSIDVDALNDVLTRLPAVMDAVTDLQSKVESLSGTLSGLSGLSSLAGLLGG